MTLAATGCLREGTEGCPACMNLMFTFAGTTAGYDSRIGNDVELQIYYGGVWHSTRLIPYERIAGGRPYNFRKTRSESIQIIAYAVPKGGNGGLIPQAAQGARFQEQVVRMADAAVRSRANECCVPKDGDIFAGVLDIEESYLVESTCEVPMKALTCRVTVMLEGAGLFFKKFPDADPSVGLQGTSREVFIYSGRREGKDVEVVSPLKRVDDNLETPVMRVLPSPDGIETLSVNFFRLGDELAFPVFRTAEVAEPDSDIIIIYRMGETEITITLEIDGWIVRTETVSI